MTDPAEPMSLEAAEPEWLTMLRSDWPAHYSAAEARAWIAACDRVGGVHVERTAPAPDVLNAAYRERAAVVAALIRTNGWKSSLVPAPDADGWFIVYAETPEGQVSWHVGPDDLDLFGGIPAEYVKWDGHDTDEKYRRVAALVERTAPLDALRETIHAEVRDRTALLDKQTVELRQALERAVERTAPLDVERLIVAENKWREYIADRPLRHFTTRDLCLFIAREYAALSESPVSAPEPTE